MTCVRQKFFLLALLGATAAGAQEGGSHPKRPAAPSAARLDAKDECADTALLRALLWAFEPAPSEVRVQAVEDLALFGDARALNALASLIFDPDLAVDAAAVRAVSQFRAPRAEEILENVVRHPRIPDSLKIQALRALPYQATRGARDFLKDAGTRPGLSAQVQAAARDVLRRAQAPAGPAPAPHLPFTAPVQEVDGAG